MLAGACSGKLEASLLAFSVGRDFTLAMAVPQSRLPVSHKKRAPGRRALMNFDDLLAKPGCERDSQRILETPAASARPPRRPSHDDPLTG